MGVSLYPLKHVHRLTVRGCLQASQSLLAVGNRPMLQHLYTPSPTQAN